MEKDSIEMFLEKFNIKSCRVNLTNMDFSKIRYGCTVKSSEPNVKLSCDLGQKNINTVTLKITRLTCGDTGSGMVGALDSQQPKSVVGDSHYSPNPKGIYYICICISIYFNCQDSIN